MPRDVTTRWNSTYQLLKFALAYRQAIDLMTERHRDLHDFQLEDDEWVVLKALKDILEVCLSAAVRY